MSTLHYEDWDTDCTPPALPSGWNVDSVFTTTSTFEGGIVPTSSPNALVLTPVDTSDHYATWGTADGVGGDVTVQANFNIFDIPTHSRIGLTARGSASTLNSSSTTQYIAYLDFDALVARIVKMISGTATTLFTLNVTGTLSDLTWYQLALMANGSTLEMTVQRLADGYYLDESGAWTNSYTPCIQGTDGSISGSGYAGIYAQQSAAGNYPLYSDDWYLDSLSAPSIPPNRPVVVQVPFGFYPCNQF